MHALRRLLPLAALIALAGCRAVAVGSDPRPTYSIEVTNESGTAMIVSYNDGRGDAILGTVTASGTERFIIASPASTAVSVSATNETRTRTLGPYSVRLVAGVAQPVRLR